MGNLYDRAVRSPRRIGVKRGWRAPAALAPSALAPFAIAALGILAGPAAPFGLASAAWAVSPRSAPVPALSPRREALIAAQAQAPRVSPRRSQAAGADAEAEAILSAAEGIEGIGAPKERVTVGRFSVAPKAQERDGQVAAAIRRAFSGRRLDDAAGREASLPIQPKSGVVSFVLADPVRGAILERRNADDRMIPASVAKAPTALYALDTLGPDYRFETRLVAKGRVSRGVLRGDLYLVGGGDPTLDNQDLKRLAEALRAAGVTRVTGRFFFDDSAIATTTAILPSQPPQAAYNPALSGLMLNFNRVRLQWERQADGAYEFTARAAAKGLSLPTGSVRGVATPSKVARTGFEWSLDPRIVGPGVRDGVVETWKIARRLLNRKGGRWLPVRRPSAFAAGVFQDLAHEAGVALPRPERAAAPLTATVLARHESAPLLEIMRAMLKHSTNITAEAVGVAASRERGLTRLEIDRSAALMSSWADTRFGILGSTAGVDARPTAFRNHSGLSTSSRLTSRAMAAILIEAARSQPEYDQFFDLLPRYRMKGLPKGAQVRAKTGTVYYGRGLAGYLACPKGKRLAFSYLHSDIPGRTKFDAAYDPASGARPGGASAWLGRARSIEKKLLVRWAKKYC
ncbi:MAG: D-alanyl-D-alanine carboxypeptidase/D-alanyl-D-alanine-endopeptidase [Pseudomonadota bacterium]